MRILIVGAGALGGYFGARLLAAGRDVTFLVRPGRAQQLASNGLRVLSPTHGDLLIERPPTVLAADLAADLAEPFDIIVLSCKARDLGNAMDSFAAAVGAHTVIVPMLNGMAHLDSLDARFGERNVLGGTCFISASLDAEGTIHHLNDRDGFFFGPRTDSDDVRLKGIEAALTGAGFNGQLRPVIVQDMFSKWTFIATLAGITCLMRCALGDLVAIGAGDLALELFAECTAIAAAERFPPPPQFIALHREILTRPGSLLDASMLRDLEADQPIEAQQIVGDLLARAMAHRLSSPMLTLAHIHLRAYEQRRERQSQGAQTAQPTPIH